MCDTHDTERTRDQAVAELAAERNYLASLLDSVSDAIITTDLDSIVIGWNRAAETIYGWTAGEAVGQHLDALINTEFVGTTTEAVYEAFARTQHWKGVVIQQRKNGQRIHIEASVSMLLDADGRPKGTISVNRDITESKMIQAEIHRHEARMRSLINILQYQTESMQGFLDYALDEAIKLSESELGYIYFYDEASQQLNLYAWSKAAREQCEICERQTTYHLADTGIWGEAIRQRKPLILNDFQAEHPLKKGYPEGHVQLTRFMTGPVFNDGQIVAVFGVANKPTDYTDSDLLQLTLLMDSVWKSIERLQAEEALRESRERFSKAFNNQPTAMVIFDLTTGERLEVNDSYVRMTGYSREELLTTDINSLELFADPEQKRASIETLLENKTVKGIPVEFVTKSGGVRNLIANAASLDSHAGNLIIASFVDITENRQIKAALHKSETRFKAIFEHVPIGVAVAGPDGRLVETNTVFEKMLGFSSEELAGMPVTQISHPEILPQEIVFFNEVEAGQRDAFTMEKQYIRKDGSSFWAQLSSIVAREANGDIEIAIGVVQDITERKAAQAQLQDQRAFVERLVSCTSAVNNSMLKLDRVLSQILEYVGEFVPHTGANIVFVDPRKGTGKIMHNCTCYAEHGLHEPVIGVEFPLKKHKSLRAVLDRQKAINIPDVKSYQDWLASPESTWIQAYAGAPIILNGEILGILNVDSATPNAFTDQHIERLQAFADQAAVAIHNAQLYQELEHYNDFLEQAVAVRTAELLNAKERAEAILSSSSDAIVLTDPDGVMKQANQAFYQLFGYAQDAEFGKPITTLIDSEYADRLHLSLQETMKTRRSSSRVEAVARSHNLSTFDVDIVASKVMGADELVVWSIRDITHLKEVERVKDQFVSMVSHELRTPISSILMSAGTLDKYYDRLSDERKRQKLKVIYQQSEKLTELVNTILDTSRMDNRSSNSYRETINVAKALHDVVDDLTERTRARQQRIDLQIGNAALTVTGEYFDIVRVWRNLLDNAIKYSNDGDTITVGICSVNGDGQRCKERLNFPDYATTANPIPDDVFSGRYIIGQVKDTGRGIPAEDLSQLFTRFFRGWASGTTITGTGLGLSLVREILQLYGGDIAVSSELGVGTTFCFWLPVEQSEGAGS
jgi:PAS domain S-box-containing protein